MIQYKTEGDAIKRLIAIKGEAFAEYRKRWDQVNSFQLESDFPLFLHIESSYQCNFQCPMCTQGNPELKAKFGYPERMTTGKILKLLKEAQKFHCPSVSFQGDNEPFLMKDLIHWFELAREHGFLDIMVNTNGSVMTEALAERTIRSGLTRLRFSLDAITEETYAKIRINGKFERTMRNIALFLQKKKELQADLPLVGVNFVRMKQNEHEIEAFVEYWNDRVDFIVLQEFMTPDTEGEYEHLSGESKLAVHNFQCNQPWQRLYIRGNGEVTPCCAMFSRYLKLGEIQTSSLESLWNGPAIKALRKLHAEGRYAENPVCLKCSKSG
ncbi:radical SAM protein [Deltaproteobacteria bacterium TL4]